MAKLVQLLQISPSTPGLNEENYIKQFLIIVSDLGSVREAVESRPVLLERGMVDTALEEAPGMGRSPTYSYRSIPIFSSFGFELYG